MNVYEAMGRIVDYAISYLDIVPDTTASNEDVATIAQLLDAYAALAPTPNDWAVYPNAMWYVIEINGDALWFEDEPTHDGWRWTNADWFNDVGYEHGRKVNLPKGIDPRLCKWSRPEVTK